MALRPFAVVASVSDRLVDTGRALGGDDKGMATALPPGQDARGAVVAGVASGGAGVMPPAPAQPGAGAAPPLPAPASAAHGFDLSAHADLDQGALGELAGIVWNAGGEQRHLDGVAAWGRAGGLDRRDWDGLIAATGGDEEMISDLMRAGAHAEVADASPLSRAEMRAARAVYAALPTALRMALYVVGANGEPNPGRDNRVLRWLSRFGAPAAAPGDFEGAARREFSMYGGDRVEVRGAASAGDEAELAQLMEWAGAPRGSYEHRKYWGNPKAQARYLELLRRRGG